MLVLFDGWTSFFRDRVVPWRIGMAEKVRAAARDRSAAALHRSRSAGTPPRARRSSAPRLVDHARLGRAAARAGCSRCSTSRARPSTARYFVPLALAWEDSDEARVRALAPATLAKVRQQANVGVMADAFADEAFCRARGRGDRRAAGELATRARHAAVHADRGLRASSPATISPRCRSGRAAGAEQQHRGDARRAAVPQGLSPPAARRQPGARDRPLPHRSRAVRATACRSPGALEYVGADGTPMTLALLQALRREPGRRLDLHARLPRALPREPARAPPSRRRRTCTAAYLALIAHARDAHRRAAPGARAAATGDPAFEPEPVTGDDLARMEGARARRGCAPTLELLERERRAELPAAARARGAGAARRGATRCSHASRPRRAGASGLAKTRYHGDYHLGQVLVASNDFVIIDFEGEPARPLARAPREALAAARRRRHAALVQLRALDRARARGAQTPSDTARLAPLAAAWEAQCATAFLARLRRGGARGGALPLRSTRCAGCSSCSSSRRRSTSCATRSNNRPDWVRIPLAGILALAGGARCSGLMHARGSDHGKARHADRAAARAARRRSARSCRGSRSRWWC